MKILIILILFSSQIFSQEKYFIYFIDKGPEYLNGLNKSSLSYNPAINSLTPKSIERRQKNLGKDFITYEDLPIYNNYLQQLENLEIKIIRNLNWFNCVSAYLTSDQISIAKNLPFVKSIEPVKKLFYKLPQINETDNSLLKISDTILNYGPSYNQMNLSDVPVVHSKNINGKNILIGVLDSGFDWERHESLTNKNVIAEYDFIFNDSTTSNQNGDSPNQHNHGTYVFSILAGFKDSVLIGPAYNSSFVLAKTEDIRDETVIEEDNYAAALIWMESLGVDITTSSLGYNIFNDGFEYSYNDMDGRTAVTTKALELAFQRGVSTFSSAGNEGDDPWFYITAPADGFNVLSVGAVTSNGIVAGFSSRGPTYDGRTKPEVSAMGVGVYGASANTDDGYGFSSGTSASAPIAAGVGALLLSAYPHLKNTQIRSIFLETSSNSSNPNNEIGYGIISAKNAIEFPNLEFNNGSYILHKAFIEDGVDTQSVKINFILAEDLLEEYQLIKSNNYDYSFQLPIHNNGKIIKFTINYKDSLGNLNFIPQNGFYKFSYGSDIINYNFETLTPVGDYEVSNFYPNPFLLENFGKISFNYHTAGNEKFKVTITDVTGQKVGEYNSITNSNPGFYTFNWNGYSDKGYLCASGVYLALIQIDDKLYGRKFILLK